MNPLNRTVPKRILITGVGGQIGSYLAEILIEASHLVIGVESTGGPTLPAGVTPIGIPLSVETVSDVLDACGPLDVVVHLAAPASVARSWLEPFEVFDGAARLTAALAYEVRKRDGLRLIHASSGEIFGRSATPVQDEDTPIAPITPYGVAKAAAHMAVRLGRDGYGAPMSNLILYPGESERRPPHFVFRKITSGLAAVRLGIADHISLGNTTAVRDFCHAKDLARAAALLAVSGVVGDYVCASGEGHSIAEVVETACEYLGLDPKAVALIDPALSRPADIPSLVGDSSRLRALGWKPELSFHQLVAKLVEHDLASLRCQAPT